MDNGTESYSKRWEKYVADTRAYSSSAALDVAPCNV